VLTFPGSYAVPGAMWPGAIWPGEVLESAPAGPPVLFSVPFARQVWSVVTARN
jgi:hypothetical protein